ncbi:probable protein S-acyltransferase 15 isoform X5 [Physcomitrium patens]|uniref:S-acyltransferase n=1 Tax=Physcomitrium patens TaxID=3218 RepID=A0A7I4DDT6_PHYPA|nr:probable protein S-acyltransferase 15 isoform X2 [Physcomitrium patens]|eukprot:XP_024370236.1 probable protein S-acyltransferase 15 isoform X2 [Physcomitrella patens]
MKRLMGILLHMKTLMPGRRREPLLLHRQFGRGCCSSDRWSVSYLWNSFVMKFQARLDYSVQVAGPLYILLAFSLISSVIYLFLDTVMPLARYEMDLEGADYAPSRWCKRCRKPKPPMTHHCHICKRCILKMDHHCPWMHNCIGYYNYRFFFVFLLYMWAGCLYAAVMSSLPMFGPEDEDDGEENGVGILFTFILSVAVLISLTFLLGWHIYLVLTAQTTIDFYGNRQRRKEARANGESWTNVYDLGKLQNLRQVTDVGGSYWWLWLLLPTRALPKGDGVHFPLKENPFQPMHSTQLGLPLCENLSPSADAGSLRSHLVSDSSSSLREMTSNDWNATDRL